MKKRVEKKANLDYNGFEISRINDFFTRYLFSKEGNEDLLLDFLNCIMKDSEMETFLSVKVVSPFNLKDNIEDSQTVVDVRAKTCSGKTVIVEIQSSGNRKFFDRILHYWGETYTSQKEVGDNYQNLHPVICVGVINFDFEREKFITHSTHEIRCRETNRVSSDKFLVHMLELSKPSKHLKENGLKRWHEFFSSKSFEKDKEEIMREKAIMKKAIETYDHFRQDKKLMEAYKKREIFLAGQASMLKYERELGVAQGKEQGIKQGLKQGIEQGEKKAKLEVARTLLQMNLSIESIQEATRLTIEEIQILNK